SHSKPIGAVPSFRLVGGNGKTIAAVAQKSCPAMSPTTQLRNDARQFAPVSDNSPTPCLRLAFRVRRRAAGIVGLPEPAADGAPDHGRAVEELRRSRRRDRFDGAVRD